MICEICGKEFESNIGFGSHIKQKHKIETKQYYDTYLKQKDEGICTCGKETKFANINIGYVKHCSLKCAHNDEESKIKRRKTNLERYGVEQVLSSYTIKEKCKETCKKLYGNEEIFKTKHFKDEYKKTSLEHFGVEHHTKQFIKKEIVKTTINEKSINEKSINEKSINEKSIKSIETNHQKLHNRTRYYEYNNIIFDSSWELATYIWHKDHNIDIIREPCTFDYIGLDFKKHTYFPDFQINNQIIEIKGNQYLKENGKLKDEAKQLCIDDNNVIIWSYNNVKPYIKYCEDLFNDKYWYKAFKYNTNYKPSHCKHTQLINTPIKCCICNKEFQNGQYLSAHLKFQEHITGKDYYDKYLKKPDEGICIVCGKPTKYINFTRGYTQTCSQECNNSPLSNKGKNVSKTKQAYSEDRKLEIKQKRINTCLKKYDVTCNLQMPEVRQKLNETYKVKGGDLNNGDS